MCREPLEIGKSITLPNGGEYVIDGIIGEGGFSLVYSVHTEGSTRSFAMKEFFPTRLAFRNNQGIPQPYQGCETSFNEYLSKFENEGVIGSHVSQNSFQTISFQQCGGGYAIMQRESEDMLSIADLVNAWKDNPPVPYTGYKTDNDIWFSDLVKVAYALRITESFLAVLSIIHQHGYLHLDISATNVIWAGHDQRTGRNCVAFLSDFGCAVPMNSDGGHISLLNTYSPGFAAPELKQRNSICTTATDLYSVGMLLFYICCPESALEITRNRKRHIERELGRLQIPSAIRQELQILVDKATTEKSDRYQSAVDMQAVIRNLSNTIDEYVALKNNSHPLICRAPSPISGFVGRDNETAALYRHLTNHNSPIFISGIGGIGKSEFALHAAQAISAESNGKYSFYRTHFTETLVDTILLLDFEGIVKKRIQDYSGDNEKNDALEKRLELLRKYDQYTVLIIDNFDSPNGDTETLLLDKDGSICTLYNALCSMQMQFIFTTRFELTGVSCLLPIGPLSTADLLCIIRRQYKKENDEIIYKLIDSVDSHTLTVDIIGRTLCRSFGLTAKGLLDALSQGIENDNPSIKSVESSYRGNRKKKSILEHLEIIFDFSDFSVEALSIMRCAALLPPYGMNAVLFESTTSKYTKNIDTIDMLVRGNWIRVFVNEFGEDTVSLHPLISSVIHKITSKKPIDVERDFVCSITDSYYTDYFLNIDMTIFVDWVQMNYTQHKHRVKDAISEYFSSQLNQLDELDMPHSVATLLSINDRNKHTTGETGSVPWLINYRSLGDKAELFDLSNQICFQRDFSFALHNYDRSFLQHAPKNYYSCHDMDRYIVKSVWLGHLLVCMQVAMMFKDIPCLYSQIEDLIQEISPVEYERKICNYGISRYFIIDDIKEKPLFFCLILTLLEIGELLGVSIVEKSLFDYCNTLFDSFSKSNRLGFFWIHRYFYYAANWYLRNNRPMVALEKMLNELQYYRRNELSAFIIPDQIDHYLVEMANQLNRIARYLKNDDLANNSCMLIQDPWADKASESEITKVLVPSIFHGTTSRLYSCLYVYVSQALISTQNPDASKISDTCTIGEKTNQSVRSAEIDKVTRCMKEILWKKIIDEIIK